MTQERSPEALPSAHRITLPAPENENLLSEFASSAWKAAVTNKVTSVQQLMGKDVAVQPERERQGMMQMAHVAGTAVGEITDLALMSTAIGKVLGGYSKFAQASSSTARLLSESALARGVTTGTTLGLIDGGLLTPTKEGESQWRRVGNAAVSGLTFGTMNGLAGRMAGMGQEGLIARLANNSTSGFVAGMVNSAADSATHGQMPETDKMLTAGVGWAVGNVAFGEGAHLLKPVGKTIGHGLDSLIGRTPAPEVAVAGAAAGALSVPREVPTFIARDAARPATPEISRSAMLEGRTRDSEPVSLRPLEPVERQADTTAESKVEVAKSRIGPIVASETVSMRKLANSTDAADLAAFEKIGSEYMPLLEKQFPLAGEIENWETYKSYLRDPEMKWDMVVLRDSEKNVVGGIQYQMLDVNGQVIKNAAWGEHIWVREEARNYPNFRALLKIAEDQVSKKGGDLVFMEFNNPDKMTPSQRVEDAAAGLAPEDREKIWGRVGMHVAVDAKGNLAEYAQPSMGEGQPPVEFLSAAFVGLKPLTGKVVPKEDYLKLWHTAHRTIDGVEIPENYWRSDYKAPEGTVIDPTVQAYTESVKAAPGNSLTFVPLNAIGRAREAAMNAAAQSMQKSIADAASKNMALSNAVGNEVNDAIANAIHERGGNITPEELSTMREALQRSFNRTVEQVLGRK